MGSQFCVLVATLLVFGVKAFTPFIPPFRRKNNRHFASLTLQASVQKGDTVVVIGGTSGVGQLVTNKLSLYNLTIRVTARNVEKAKEIIGDSQPSLEFLEVDLTGDNLEAQLRVALKDANALVISVGTTAFPTAKWRGGNTPAAIDKDAVSTIAKIAASVGSLKKVVHLTSVGVERTKEMPFLILNLFGVLDAKKAGEDAIKKAAFKQGFDYAIVRPGRLIGGPFTNLDVAKLMQIEGGSENGVDLAPGDSLLGDCKRDACAEAIVQCLTNDACSNISFSIASNDSRALTVDQWADAFRSMQI
jgi:uncharacterized protein YbjT (DUF2867 family)